MSEKTSFEGRIVRAGCIEGEGQMPSVVIEVPWRELEKMTVNMIYQRVRVEILPTSEPKAE